MYVFPAFSINLADSAAILIGPVHGAANVTHLGAVRRGFRCLRGFPLMATGFPVDPEFVLSYFCCVGVCDTQLVLLLGPRVMFAAN